MTDPKVQKAPQIWIPDPHVPSSRLRIDRNNEAGLIEISFSRDGGKTWKLLSQEPSPNLPLNAVQAKQADGSVKWINLEELISEAVRREAYVSQGLGGDLFYVDVPFFGEAYTGYSFGFYQNASSSSSVTCYGLQITAQEPPIGTNLQVDIVNQSGINQNRIATLPELAAYSSSTFPSPLVMSPLSIWRFQFLTVGSTSPGSSFNFRLIMGS